MTAFHGNPQTAKGAGAQVGDCTVSTGFDPEVWPRQPWVRIDRADPVIHVSDDLLADANDSSVITPGLTFGEGLVRIDADNGTVRYQLEEHDPSRRCWRATRYGALPDGVKSL